MKRLLVILLVLLIVPTASAQPPASQIFTDSYYHVVRGSGVNMIHEAGTVQPSAAENYRVLNGTHRYRMTNYHLIQLKILVLDAHDITINRDPTPINILIVFIGEVILDDVMERGDSFSIQIHRYGGVLGFTVNVTADVGYFSTYIDMFWVWESYYTIEEIPEETTPTKTEEPVFITTTEVGIILVVCAVAAIIGYTWSVYRSNREVIA